MASRQGGGDQHGFVGAARRAVGGVRSWLSGRAGMPRLHGESVVTHVGLIGQLRRWIAGARGAVEDLTPARLAAFLDSGPAGGPTGYANSPVARPLVAH